MDFTIAIDGDGWTATRTGLTGLSSLVNGLEVFFKLMDTPSTPRIVVTRRGGASWEAWPDLFEPCTHVDFHNCWQIVAGVTLPT